MRSLGLPPSSVLGARRRLFSCKVLPTFPSSAPSHFPPRLPICLLSTCSLFDTNLSWHSVPGARDWLRPLLLSPSSALPAGMPPIPLEST